MITCRKNNLILIMTIQLLWLFSSQFESSKRKIVAHVCISNPQACSPGKRKGHQCTKETQKISQAQLRAHRANPSTSKGTPCDARVINPRSSMPSPKHPLCPPYTSTQSPRQPTSPRTTNKNTKTTTILPP